MAQLSVRRGVLKKKKIDDFTTSPTLSLTMFRLVFLMILVGLAEANLSTLTPLEFRRAEERAPSNEDTAVQFYGKISNTCDESAGDNCFRAVVTGGRTDFTGEGGDLANIYVETNDYDTWKQNAVGMKQIEGEFVYQLQN